MRPEGTEPGRPASATLKVAASSAGDGNRGASAGSDGERRPSEGRVTVVPPADAGADRSGGYGAPASANASGAAGKVEVPYHVQQVDMAARIARVLEAQEAAGPRSLSSVLLRLDNAAGGEDRIRVDMRGTAVDARLELGDEATARRADAQLHELRAALNRSGLDAQTLRVRSTTTTADGMETVRAAAALVDDAQRAAAGRNTGDGPAQRRAADEQAEQHNEPRPDPDKQSAKHQTKEDLT